MIYSEITIWIRQAAAVLATLRIGTEEDRQIFMRQTCIRNILAQLVFANQFKCEIMVAV